MPRGDLAVRAPDGKVAGCAQFWYDPVTRFGLVELMRVADAYQRRGLARALLTEGLQRLARRVATVRKPHGSRNGCGYRYRPVAAICCAAWQIGCRNGAACQPGP